MPPGVMGGGSDSGAILAAMDVGATRGPSSAGLPGLGRGSNDNGVHVQLHALAKIHDQKVRTLMRSVAELKKKLLLATAQGKDHRRSAMIRAMRTRLREQELVIDVIKEELGNRSGMGKEETNDWVIRKTVGGPLRFRPKTREELQNELYRLEKKHRHALNRLKARSEAGRGVGVDEPATTEERPPAQLEAQADAAPEVAFNEALNPRQEQQAGGTSELMRLSEALEEVDALRVSVRSRDAALQAQAQTVDQLLLENRELRGVQERLARKERRARDLKKKNALLGEQHTALLEDYEACQEQNHHLKAQLELRKEEALAEADEFREHSLRQAEEVSVLLKREEELATALEEEAASRQRERRDQHHANRQALSRAEAAEKSLQAAEREGRRLREQNGTMLAELQRLGKEAAEAAGLRERGRELAVETKRMAKEAEARQGRLEEARERGATAEEALRASKESLEAERQSTEALTREASEVKAQLEEERVRLETERKRADDEGEARRRLESLLATEKKREEDMGVAAAAAAAEAAAQIAAANAAAAAAKEAAAALFAAEKAKETKTGDTVDADRGRGVSVAGADADGAEAEEAAKRRALSESEEIIEEMETELREQADQITRLEEGKHALEVQLESATKVVEELRAKNSSLTAQLNAAAATAAAAAAAAEAEAASSTRKDENSAPASPRRRLRPSTSAEEKECKLREELAAAKASERSARNECRSLKLELDDAKASCELQKTRVKDLVARKVSTVLDDDGCGGGGAGGSDPVAAAAGPSAGT